MAFEIFEIWDTYESRQCIEVSFISAFDKYSEIINTHFLSKIKYFNYSDFQALKIMKFIYVGVL